MSFKVFYLIPDLFQLDHHLKTKLLFDVLVVLGWFNELAVSLVAWFQLKVLCLVLKFGVVKLDLVYEDGVRAEHKEAVFTFHKDFTILEERREGYNILIVID